MVWFISFLSAIEPNEPNKPKKPNEPDEQERRADGAHILREGESADESGRFQSQGLRRNGRTLWRGSTPNQDIRAEVGPIWPNDRP